MTRYRGYVEWDSKGKGENELANNSPFDDPGVRKRMIEIIIRTASGTGSTRQLKESS